MKYINAVLAILAVGIFFILSLKLPNFILKQKESQSLNRVTVLERPDFNSEDEESEDMATREKLEFLAKYVGTDATSSSGAVSNDAGDSEVIVKEIASSEDQAVLQENILIQLNKMINFGAFPDISRDSFVLRDSNKRSYVQVGEESRMVTVWELRYETEQYHIYLKADAETFVIYEYYIALNRSYYQIKEPHLFFDYDEDFKSRFANSFSLYLGIEEEDFQKWFQLDIGNYMFGVLMSVL